MNNPKPQVFAVVPCTNDDPYLVSCISHLTTFVDDYYVHYDPKGRLLQHEGNWRTGLLETAVSHFKPISGIDWILVNDSDEFLGQRTPFKLQDELGWAVADATYKHHATALLFAREELWELDPPYARVDKAWGNQKNLRMFRYVEGMPLNTRDVPLACGSIPVAAEAHALDVSQRIKVTHAGYAAPDDRKMRFERYIGKPGHGPAHIESILDSAPTLVPAVIEAKIERWGK